MTSKAQRRKRKISLPGGKQIDQPPKQGRRRDIEDARAVTETVATARVRRSGILDLQEALQPLCGTDMGLCIHAMTKGDERAALREAWQAISASFRNYRLLVIGQTGDPQGAAIGMVPEKMETDPSLRVDLRSHDEKVTAAKSSKAAWDARINTLPVPNMRWALRGALEGFLGDGRLWKDQAPTPTGRLAVEALRRVMEK